jgi:hypothetical protein
MSKLTSQYVKPRSVVSCSSINANLPLKSHCLYPFCLTLPLGIRGTFLREVKTVVQNSPSANRRTKYVIHFLEKPIKKTPEEDRA